MQGNREKNVWIKIIDRYRETPYLWDKKNCHYKNKNMRLKSFRALLEIYHEIDEDATIDILKSKIINMRTSFLREYKKVQSGVQVGSGSDTCPYVPTLWYYDHLMFLVVPGHVPRKSSDEADVTSESTQSTPPYKKIRASIKKEKSERRFLQMAEQAAYKPDRAEEMDEFDSFGRMMALELRKLTHPHQPIAQKLISDVLYYAKMGKLTESTSISMPIDPCNIETHYYLSSPDEKVVNESDDDK